MRGIDRSATAVALRVSHSAAQGAVEYSYGGHCGCRSDKVRDVLVLPRVGLEGFQVVAAKPRSGELYANVCRILMGIVLHAAWPMPWPA